MDQYGDAFAPAGHRRDCSPGGRAGKRKRSSAFIDVPVTEPVAQLQRRIAERARDPITQRDRFRQAPEIDDKPRHGRLRPVAAQKVGEQAAGNRRQHRLVCQQRGLGGIQSREPRDRAEPEHQDDARCADARDDASPSMRAGRPQVRVARREHDRGTED